MDAQSKAIEDALSKASPDAVREVQRQAESILQGTVQFAIAADQRATTMAGICGAGATALGAAAIALYTETKVDGLLISGAAVAASLLFVAAIIFSWSSRPIEFYTDGYEPRLLARSATDEKLMSIAVASDLQARICNNRNALKRAATFFKCASWMALCALPVGAVLAVGSLICS